MADKRLSFLNNRTSAIPVHGFVRRRFGYDMGTTTEYHWRRCTDEMPPHDVMVMTKIDDEKGVRQKRTLSRKIHLMPAALTYWTTTGGRVAVHEWDEKPTHWAYVR
jgi:hypothetical protein